MADEGIANDHGGDDEVARLVALTERQHELWSLLRDEKDEAVRNELFDELTANREELGRLKERLSTEVDGAPPVPPTITPSQGSDVDRPRSVGEELRAKILSPQQDVAPAQPPPPPPPSSPPPSYQPIAAEEVEDAPAVPPTLSPPTEAEPDFEEPDRDETVDSHGRLTPEKTPFSSREADLAATRGKRLVAAEAPEPAESPAPEEPYQPTADERIEEHRRTAHERYAELAKVRPQHSRSFSWLAIVFAIAAVAVAVWFLFFFDRGDDTESAVTTTTTSAGVVVETSATSEQIQRVVDGLGLGSIVVSEQDGRIILSGSVATEIDRNTVIGAAEALAGGMPLDAAGLTVEVASEDLRLAALEAIAAAGFDKINVSVSGGVATLSGVTPEGGSDELIAAVRAVDGISQVVDLTETSDRAEALASELNRIISVTPIVFGSGQIALNTLQERILDSAAEIILAYDGPIVTIVGYTDAAGTTEENERISLQRAERVRDYLIAQGVPEDRLVVQARGESESTGAVSVAGLERRVEFEVGYSVPAGGNASFRIGIVAPSARDDLAFTQSIVDAAEVIAAERGGVGIDISDGLFVTEDAEAAIRQYAADGYDLVIAHGSQYGQSVAAIAPEFPNVAFAWGTAADTFNIPNISAYEVAADQGGYVLGAVAAQLTQSDVIGIIGPLEVGDAQLYIDGFRAGVAATNPQIQVLTTYTGSFGDLGLAAEAATSHIAAGADVLTGSAQMVVGAVGVAAENDALWFGNQANQSELASGLVVASQVYHWEVALRQIIDGLDQGSLGGETYTLTLANGGVVIEYNPGFAVNGDVIATADAITAGIINGSIVTGL